MRVHIDTNASTGWEEIDAVRLHALLPPGPGPDPVVSGDCNDNGTVGFGDLNTLLAAWGVCSPG